MAGGKEEYNAFFYSLVSTDTQVRLYSLFVCQHVACYVSIAKLCDIQFVGLNAGDVLLK